jgi:CheY-like chemotaxis protein
VTFSILVVDDEKNIRTTLADILEGEGYDVRTADTGEQAVRLCRKQPFDVVLMDVRMPGMDGFEAFRVIRRHRPDAQVIMMSAYSTNEFRRVAQGEGATAFLRKPLDVDHLIDLLK